MDESGYDSDASPFIQSGKKRCSTWSKVLHTDPATTLRWLLGAMNLSSIKHLAERTGASDSAYPVGAPIAKSETFKSCQLYILYKNMMRIQCAYPRLSMSIGVLHPKLILLLESLQSSYTPAILSCQASPLQRRWCPVSGLFKSHVKGARPNQCIVWTPSEKNQCILSVSH